MSNLIFDLNLKAPKSPDISVICLNKNHGEFLEDNILSVFSQKFENFEYIIADGGSTDRSLEIIQRHKFIHLLPGPDASPGEGFLRALNCARGRNIMVTTSTDGYLSRNWFQRAVGLLDSDPQLSLVYGASAVLTSDGSLGNISFPNRYPFEAVPQKEQMAKNWLISGIDGSYFPELNYCVKAEIYKKLIGPSEEFPELNTIDPVLRFHFEFNRLGYLSAYLPILANFGRHHPGQLQMSEKNILDNRIYNETWQTYRARVLSSGTNHFLRDSTGTPIAILGVSA
jgi:glycosyltransferase involved in cell wall biosynthesis